VYGGQQESGSAMVSSRGNDGQITFREWHPAGGDEYGYLAADPLNPRHVYGGRINRYDKITGEIVDRRPKGSFRTLRTAPVLFAPTDPKVLYFAVNMLFKTTDGGQNWDTISPDLTRETYDVPASVGKFMTPAMKTMPRRGVIYTVAPSYVDGKVIWCGTDDGLIWVTRDGGATWKNVTPPSVTAWSKVSIMDAGHFDVNTAYAAVNRIRCDDQKPHIYKTHDAGATWTEIVQGLPEDPINVVREDPLIKGLLYCGSERMVYASFDDGSSWISLRQNMPCTSIRDLVVHESDLVVGTHGRGFWILDNVSRFRNLPSAAVHLFAPEPAVQVDRNTNSDTPLPPDEPRSKNPPDGAMLEYYLGKDAKQVTITVADAAGKVVRTFSSDDPVKPVDPKTLTVMEGWIRPPKVPGKTQGAHRFVWDLRLSGTGGRFGPPISAIWGDTPIGSGPWVPAGTYTVRLTVDGQSQEKSFEIRPDPRKANQ
jgi:hypothetical protein